MATIGKRINGENDKPERYALIYVEGEQDLNINITGEVALGNSPFSSQAAIKRATAEFTLLTVISLSLATDHF